MRIALGQFNAVVGDLAGNAAKMREIYKLAMEKGADLVVFPELGICGYPPEDLLHKRDFLEGCRTSIEDLARQCREKTIIAGFAEEADGKCYNSAGILQKGKINKSYRKGLLPNQGVFDEHRYFTPSTVPTVIEIEGIRIALTICADIWDIEWLEGFLKKEEHFDMVVNISASPFHMRKTEERLQVLKICAKSFKCAAAYCNLVGGQDELIFDGRSMFVDSKGKLLSQAKGFEEDLLIADITKEEGKITITCERPFVKQQINPLDEVYHALVLGTRDYTRKNGFEKVLIGISGGIDSAVVAAIAAAALGAENVIGISMPTRFNAAETKADAEQVAKNLGVRFLTIPIEKILGEFNQTLLSVQGWTGEGIAYENLQARIRGSVLMSLSNKFGYMVLTTGNKSETAVGYSTLYGDTAGGFAVIKDVLKTKVYELAGYINKKAGKELIPEAVIKRAPSAELRSEQKDSDSLPVYEVLDKILKGYVEQDKPAQELIESGLPAEDVYRVIRLIDHNEYKRRQSPPGVKITPKAFGKDRRLPITNRYKPWNKAD